VFLRSTWASVLTARGDLLDAEQQMLRAFGDARECPVPPLAACLLVGAEWDAATGTDPASSRFAAELGELLDQPGSQLQFAYCLARPARILASAGRVELLEQLVKSAAGGNLLYDLSRTAASAVLAQARGDFAAAADLHDRAAVAWASYGNPLEHAHSLLGAVACRTELGLPVRQPLLDAEATLERIGAAPLLAHTRQLLALDA
jgi:hypothetical protein